MPETRPTLADLAADPSRAGTLTGVQAAAVLAEMAALQTALAARLAVPEVAPCPAENDEEYLTPDQVATMLHKPRHSVYGLARRADWKPFVVRLNKKTLRFRKAGLLRLIARLVKQEC